MIFSILERILKHYESKYMELRVFFENLEDLYEPPSNKQTIIEDSPILSQSIISGLVKAKTGFRSRSEKPKGKRGRPRRSSQKPLDFVRPSLKPSQKFQKNDETS